MGMNQVRILVGGGIIIGAVAWGVTGLGITNIDISVTFGVPFLLLLGLVVLFGSFLDSKKPSSVSKESSGSKER